MLIRYLLIALLIAAFNQVFPQSKKSKEETEWVNGVIYNSSGKPLERELSYDNFDLLKVKTGDSFRSFGPHQITAFKLSEKSKYFFSTVYKDPSDGKSLKSFFRIMYQNSRFMILSRYSFQHYSNPGHTDQSGLYYPGTSGIHVYRTLYLANKKGKMLAVLRGKVPKYLVTYESNWEGRTNQLSVEDIEDSESSKFQKSLFGTQLDYRFIDKSRFEEFFGREHYKFNQFVQENKCNIKTFDGLKTALNFYF